jgi:hypothetical protein
MIGADGLAGGPVEFAIGGMNFGACATCTLPAHPGTAA